MKNKVLEEKLNNFQIKDFSDENGEEADPDAELSERLFKVERRGGRPSSFASPVNRFASEFIKGIKRRYEEKPILKICQKCIRTCKQTEAVGFYYFECPGYEKA